MIKSRFSDTTTSSNTILDVILDDGDEVIECVENAFLQNNLKKAILVDASGKLKNVRIATTRAGLLRQKEYNESCLIKNVSGSFTKMKGNEYVGDFHISVARDKIQNISGVLIKGFADGEVKISFKIVTDMAVGDIVPPKEQTLVKQKILGNDISEKPKKPIIIG